MSGGWDFRWTCTMNINVPMEEQCLNVKGNLSWFFYILFIDKSIIYGWRWQLDYMLFLQTSQPFHMHGYLRLQWRNVWANWLLQFVIIETMGQGVTMYKIISISSVERKMLFFFWDILKWFLQFFKINIQFQYTFERILSRKWVFF